MLVFYQHPLAYLLGVEGIALLRAFAGDYDRDFTEARLSEVRMLLDSAGQLGAGTWTRPITAWRVIVSGPERMTSRETG